MNKKTASFLFGSRGYYLMGSDKKVSVEPIVVGLGRWLLAYPIYVVKTTMLESLGGAQVVLVGGGGGQCKTGVPNAFVSLACTIAWPRSPIRRI